MRKVKAGVVHKNDVIRLNGREDGFSSTARTQPNFYRQCSMGKEVMSKGGNVCRRQEQAQEKVMVWSDFYLPYA